MPGDYRYHEVYVDPKYDEDGEATNEGFDTFQFGSKAFHALVHELGHSVVGGGHALADPTRAIMKPTTGGLEGNSDASPASQKWHPSTPMTLDIDKAVGLHGETTTTRTGDDTYGFNARFSDDMGRAAFNFDINKRPLVTIFDNDGNDTLDASGFRNAGGASRQVKIDLNPGGESYMREGMQQTFAVIYRTTWIENAVGGDNDDIIIGNARGNTLEGGDGADELYGEGDHDVLIGGWGEDWLDGGSSGDEMRGGRHDDDYIVDHPDDQVIEAANYIEEWGGIPWGGRDTVRILSDESVWNGMTNYTLRANVENGIIKGDAEFNLAGNELRNKLDGNDAPNLLLGNHGNDDLYGWGGNDRLFGGRGADEIYGGDDDDRLYLDNGNEFGGDIAVGGSGYDRVHADVGVDGLRLNLFADGTPVTAEVNQVAYTSAAMGVEHVEGSSGKDRIDASRLGVGEWVEILGMAGDDTFVGGGDGYTILRGGADNDEYLNIGANDMVLENAGEGTDTVVTTLRSYDLDDNVENLTIKSDGGYITGNGNELDNVLAAVNTFVPSPDWVNALTFELNGFGGEDTLIGSTAHDKLKGGADNDTYRNVSDGDAIIEQAGEGIDTVHTESVRYRLAANVESLVVVSEMFSLVWEMEAHGNDLGNEITADERFSFAGGQMPDTRFRLFGHGDADTLNGGYARSGDLLDGGEGDDTLNGLGGFDTLRGGIGADTLNGGGANDYADYSLAVEAVVVDLAAGGLAGEALGDTFESIEGVNGSTHADRILGNAEANFLDGLGGADILEGRGGDDWLTGGAEKDSFAFTTGWGQDTITDFVDGLEVLDMTGVSGLTSYGKITSVEDSVDGAVITYLDSSITLNGIAASQISAADFKFAAAPPVNQSFDGTEAGAVPSPAATGWTR